MNTILGKFSIIWLPCLCLLALLFSGGCSFKKSKVTPVEEQLVIVTATFSSLMAGVFEPKCAGCHKVGTKDNHYVVLTSFDSIVNNNLFPPLVSKGDPTDSSIFDSVAKGRMPKNGALLSDHEVEMIYTWIQNGAPEVGAGEAPVPCEETEEGCDPGCDPEDPFCDDNPACDPDDFDCEPEDPACEPDDLDCEVAPPLPCDPEDFECEPNESTETNNNRSIEHEETSIVSLIGYASKRVCARKRIRNDEFVRRQSISYV